MVKKLLCYLIFMLLETAIILGSAVIVVCFYLPFVALKAAVLTLTGKATVKARDPDSIPETNG